MTCKNCIHYEICQIMYEQYGIYKVGVSQCGYFKDKELIVELPRKVGDLVYVFCWKRKRTNGKYGYWNSIITTEKVFELAATHGEIYIDCKKATKTDLLRIGKTVFLTREEAEQALEERGLV